MVIIEVFKVIIITFLNIMYGIFNLVCQILPIALEIKSIPKEGLALILGIPTICLSIIIFSVKFIYKRIK